LRFDVTTGTGWSSDIAIDNITVDASGGGSGSPDLTIQSMSAPSSAVAGTAVTASCSVRNIGSATASSSTMAYYISTNSTYSGDDVLVGTDAVSSLGAGSASSESASITIPGGLSAGTYYILFRADYTSAVTESNESNNVGARSISITSAPSCSDGIQNGDETGVDCGGSCPNTCGGSGGPSLWSQNGSAIFYNTGNVGIGISNPTEILTVNGTVLAKEFKATLNYAWPDYVFLPTYPIMPLKELEAYIQKYGHLPNIPSAEEVEEKGVNLTEMNTKLLEKVEELTLHIIALEKRIKELEKQ
ncbi:MAG: CARDB domain-containing protein, partial [Bacteroidota bacterium]